MKTVGRATIKNPFSPVARPVKPPKPMTFEEAMKLLRAGKPVRRRGWHSNSFIFRLKENVFVQLPGKEPGTDHLMGANYQRAPDVWRPYPVDFLATDWEKA
jgi:Protein of unknown function (DUF2829)